MGLIGIILERSKAFREVGQTDEKMFLIGPSLISQYLSFYHYNFEPVLTHLYQVGTFHKYSYSNSQKIVHFMC